MQSTLNESDAGLWKEIAPLLDTAVARLNEKDRRAIVLRFYEGRDLGEVGAALGANEEAAKKRISRALEKLRAAFAKRGVRSTAEAIAGSISANSVLIAPAVLAKVVTATAIAEGATASTSILSITRGALKIMAWTKMKTAALAGVAVILAAAGTTSWVLQHHRSAEAVASNAVSGASEASRQSLQGNWTGSNTAHPGQTCTVAISGDQIEYHGADPKDWLQGKFVLNDKTKPWQMDVTVLEPARNFILGIYEVNGYSVKIAVAPHGSNRRPVNFTAGRISDVLELKHD